MFKDDLRQLILARCKERFCNVNNRWWILDDGYWTQIAARDRLFRAIHTTWSDVRKDGDPWPRDYLVNRMISEMAFDFWCKGLPGRLREQDD